MKYILYWEINPDRLDEAIKKLSKIVPDESGKYPKKLSASYSLGGQLYGIRLVEATDEQLTNLMVNALPDVSFRFEPIFEFPEIVKKYRELRTPS